MPLAIPLHSFSKIGGCSHPQLLNAPEAKEIPVWLSQLRPLNRGFVGKEKK